MTELLVLIRNTLLAFILAWLGMEFAPPSSEKPADEKPEAAVATSAFC